MFLNNRLSLYIFNVSTIKVISFSDWLLFRWTDKRICEKAENDNKPHKITLKNKKEVTIVVN